ncbi:MAG: hypothetical protein DMG02_10245 [Acidobacteria bacterium]|nr:MAG: hypothetical protein DMG02_10245 [Acidobacteriota bacterium]
MKRLSSAFDVVRSAWLTCEVAVHSALAPDDRVDDERVLAHVRDSWFVGTADRALDLTGDAWRASTVRRLYIASRSAFDAVDGRTRTRLVATCVGTAASVVLLLLASAPSQHVALEWFIPAAALLVAAARLLYGRRT